MPRIATNLDQQAYENMLLRLSREACTFVADLGISYLGSRAVVLIGTRALGLTAFSAAKGTAIGVIHATKRTDPRIAEHNKIPIGLNKKIGLVAITLLEILEKVNIVDPLVAQSNIYRGAYVGAISIVANSFVDSAVTIEIESNLGREAENPHVSLAEKAVEWATGAAVGVAVSYAATNAAGIGIAASIGALAARATRATVRTIQRRFG